MSQDWAALTRDYATELAQAAVRQGATRAEVLEAIGTAIYMGAGPSVMDAARALEAFDQFAGPAAAGCVRPPRHAD